MSFFVCYPRSALAAVLALLICQGCGQTGALYLPKPELPKHELPQAELPQSESPQANTSPAKAPTKTEADEPRTSRP